MKKCTEAGKPSKRLWKWCRRILLILAALLLVLVISVGISVVVCRSALVVHGYSVEIDGLQEPMTAVLLTDLHGREFGAGNERLLEMVREQTPDVIFCVGDMINGTADEAEVSRVMELFAKLGEIAPVYVAYGNHEQQYMSRGGKLEARISESGAILLNEECVTAELGGNTICIGGTLGHLYPFGRSREQYRRSPEYLLMTEMQNSGLPTIVLAHLPDTIIFVHAYNDWDIDLFLSGHTHGGVARIPFVGGLYAPMQGWFPDYDMGYFNPGKIQLVISSGLDAHGSVPRIFNRPEVCVIELLPTS